MFDGYSSDQTVGNWTINGRGSDLTTIIFDTNDASDMFDTYGTSVIVIILSSKILYSVNDAVH